MLAYSWASLKVNSAKAKSTSVLGSLGLRTLGSTRAGPPGLSRKVSFLPRAIQMRPPAIWGMVAVRVLPGLPRGIAQS
jgi:hypothetical protein